MSKKKIAILLPFKDNFTNSKAGSASIWVKDFNKKSLYKNQIAIFGNTDDSYDLIDNKNYINLSLSKLTIGSKNILYVKEFIKHYLKHKFDLIEIHNRPSYVHQLIENKIDANLVLIFHNNPLSLGGSSSLKERKVLLNRCDNLIFVSYWVKEKFFEGFDYLTGKLMKLNLFKKISLLIFTMVVYPFSFFVLLCLYLIGFSTVIIAKSLSWVGWK